MNYEYLRLERADRIATLMIDRPDKLNALNAATVRELDHAIRALREDEEVRGIIVTGAGEKAFVEAITVRTEGTAGIDVDAARELEGVAVLDDTMPLAPTREFARPVLGRVGDATAEIVEESKGAVVAGDQVGLSGLQRQYDEQLRGTPGVSIFVVPEGGEADAVPTEAVVVELVAGVLAPNADPDLLRVMSHGTFGFMIAAIESWIGSQRPPRDELVDNLVVALASGLQAVAGPPAP